MSRTIRTTKQDIYINRVKNAASQEGRDVDSSDYIFNYQYELFSLGLVVGYLKDERIEIEEDEGYSQEILKVGQLDEKHEHRVSVDIINQLVLMETDESDLDVLADDFESESDLTDPEDVWPIVLQYADWGVEYIDDEVSTQEDLDLVGLVRDFETPEWRERLREVIVHPDAQNR